MSEFITAAVDGLNQKLDGKGFEHRVRFDIPGEGVFVVDDSGARVADEEGEVTLTAKSKVFAGIMDGSQNPMTAVMMGKLKISGDMSIALKLGALFG